MKEKYNKEVSLQGKYFLLFLEAVVVADLHYSGKQPGNGVVIF